MTAVQNQKLGQAMEILSEHFNGAIIVVSALGPAGNDFSARWTGSQEVGLGLLAIGEHVVKQSLGAAKQ